MNRVDEIVCFNHLTEEHFKRIARLMLDELKDVMEEKHILLSYEDSVLDYLSKKSYSLTYGARNLRRTIQKEIEDKIAAEIVDAHKGRVRSVALTAGEDSLTVIAME